MRQRHGRIEPPHRIWIECINEWNTTESGEKQAYGEELKAVTKKPEFSGWYEEYVGPEELERILSKSTPFYHPFRLVTGLYQSFPNMDNVAGIAFILAPLLLIFLLGAFIGFFAMLVMDIILLPFGLFNLAYRKWGI